MDRAEIVADIRSSLFPTSLLRRGYDMGAVDDVLDDLVTRIEEGEAADEIERFVSGLAFATAVGGYDEAPVDDLLHRVVAAEGGGGDYRPARADVRVRRPGSGAGAGGVGTTGIGAHRAASGLLRAALRPLKRPTRVVRR
jgi:DivIVA domain-containing protein